MFDARRTELRKKILSERDISFQDLALSVFHFQYDYNNIYRRYVELIGVEKDDVDEMKKIPFLPISLFKNFEIKTGSFQEELIFTSSGTTGQVPSRHFVRDAGWYHAISKRIFQAEISGFEDLQILALLPSYLERKGSSLVEMVRYFLEFSKGGFYLNDLGELIKQLGQNKGKTLLIGVSFALLELAEKYEIDLKNIMVMETGGMKGRRKEMTRKELHEELKSSFSVNTIYSEYGMTELLSQAYSKGDGVFKENDFLRILIRDSSDPFFILNEKNRVGGANIIDLGNIDSCAFIATEDLGRKLSDNTFEILGRFDESEARGCNLMVM